MCLRFVFLLTTRVVAGLRLSRREEAWQITEILILRHQLAVLQRQPRRPKLNWADRALLAILLGVIPNARRHGLRLLVTPDTILRWHRDIIRRRWAAKSIRGKTGRPATRRNIKTLVLLGCENPEWGYRRIHGELAGLGVKIAASTVWEILKKAGIDPAPRRSGPTWPQFLRSQQEAILACDFFTADLLDGTQAYVLAVIEHTTRRIRILGVTLHPTGEWTAQQARNLMMDLGGQVHRVKFMIRDRGSNFTTAFDAVLAGAGIRTVLCNVQTPRMNAIAERWVGGCRRERVGHGKKAAKNIDAWLAGTAPASRPHPHLESGPSAADPAPVRDPPKSAPAASLARCRCPAETATSTGRSQAISGTKADSRQRHDSRISPGRVAWMGLSALTIRTHTTADSFATSIPATTS